MAALQAAAVTTLAICSRRCSHPDHHHVECRVLDYRRGTVAGGESVRFTPDSHAPDNVRTKLALGLFAMTIVYSLLTLRSVEKQMSASEVPHVAVSLGLLLALACVLALLFFLHFIARSVVADEVIRRAAAELEENIEQLPALEHGNRARPTEEFMPVKNVTQQHSFA